MQIAPITLPPATPDQIEYLEKIRRATEDYDGSAIVGGPQKEKDMEKSFWVLEAMWQPPHYLCVQKVGSVRQFRWTKEIDRALQFMRPEDVDAILELCLWGQDADSRSMVSGPGPMPRPVEHAYLSKTQAA